MCLALFFASGFVKKNELIEARTEINLFVQFFCGPNSAAKKSSSLQNFQGVNHARVSIDDIVDTSLILDSPGAKLLQLSDVGFNVSVLVNDLQCVP